MEKPEVFINLRCAHAHNFKFDENLVLLGFSDNVYTDRICDLIVLMAKFYIYRCKVKQVNLSLMCLFQSSIKDIALNMK